MAGWGSIPPLLLLPYHPPIPGCMGYSSGKKEVYCSDGGRKKEEEKLQRKEEEEKGDFISERASLHHCLFRLLGAYSDGTRDVSREFFLFFSLSLQSAS